MEAPPIFVNRQLLTVARESRGLTQTDLAASLNVTQGMVSKIELGSLNISGELLNCICETLHYPESFFRSSDVVYGPGVSEFYHRSLKKVSKRLINKIYAEINIKLIQLSRLLRNIELESPRAVPLLDIDEFDGKPDKIAQTVRAQWLVPRGPIANMTDLIEDASGIVVMFDFGTRDVSAISRWVPGMPPVFFVNQDMPADRVRLTLAHELGHMVMHRSTNPQMEEQAYLFANEFLMPADEIRWQLKQVSLPSLADLKPYWKVSMGALLHRAGDLGYLTANQQRYLWSQMNRTGYSRKEPAPLDLRAEPPSLLGDIVRHHVHELELSQDDFAALVSLYPDEAARQYLGQASPSADAISFDASEAIAEVERIIRYKGKSGPQA